MLYKHRVSGTTFGSAQGPGGQVLPLQHESITLIELQDLGLKDELIF